MSKRIYNYNVLPFMGRPELQSIGVYAFKSVYLNSYVRVKGDDILIADKASIENKSKFTIYQDGNKFILRTNDGNYVRVRDNDKVLVADTGNQNNATKFKVVSFGNGEIALQAPDGKFVRAREEDKILVAKADDTGNKTKFTTILVSTVPQEPPFQLFGNYAIKSIYLDKYVRLRSENIPELVADRDDVGNRSKFRIYKDNNDKYIIQADNNKYIKVKDDDGVLVANAGNPENATKFNLIYLDNKEYVFQASNGKYVRARENDGLLVAKADDKGNKTRFKLKAL